MSKPETTGPAAGIAAWIRGRVVAVEPGCVNIRLGGVEHMVTRAQAIALGTRLLETGIGTNFASEREINSQIGDLVAQARTLQHG